MSSNKPPKEDKPKDNPEDNSEDKPKDNPEEDDPLGIGLNTNTLYIIIGICVCIILLCILGSIFWLRWGSSSNGIEDTSSGECCPTPTHYTIEFKYADGVNPYNNFSIPPVVPKPQQFFGTNS